MSYNEVILLSVLRYLKEEGPVVIYNGLCGNIALLGGDKKLFKKLARQWPGFSGYDTFPIQYGDAWPSSSYFNLPLWEGEYGALRKDLLNFCIETLEFKQEHPVKYWFLSVLRKFKNLFK